MVKGKKAQEAEPASNMVALMGGNDFLDWRGGRISVSALTEKAELC